MHLEISDETNNYDRQSVKKTFLEIYVHIL